MQDKSIEMLLWEVHIETLRYMCLHFGKQITDNHTRGQLVAMLKDEMSLEELNIIYPATKGRALGDLEIKKAHFNPANVSVECSDCKNKKQWQH